MSHHRSIQNEHEHIANISRKSVINTRSFGLEERIVRVRAELDAGQYPTGVTVRKKQMDALALVPDAFHGEWNYKLLPR